MTRPYGPPYVPVGQVQAVSRGLITLSTTPVPTPVQLYPGDVFYLQMREVYQLPTDVWFYGVTVERPIEGWTFLYRVTSTTGEAQRLALPPGDDTVERYYVIYRGLAVDDPIRTAGDYLTWTPKPNRALDGAIDGVAFPTSSALLVRDEWTSFAYPLSTVHTYGDGDFRIGTPVTIDAAPTTTLFTWSQDYEFGVKLSATVLREGTVTASVSPNWRMDFPDSYWTRFADPNVWPQTLEWGEGRMYTTVLSTSLVPVTHRPTLGVHARGHLPKVASRQGEHRFYLGSIPALATAGSLHRSQRTLGTTAAVGHLDPLGIALPLPDVPIGTVEQVAEWSGNVGTMTPLPFKLRVGDWLHATGFSNGYLRTQGFTVAETPGGSSSNIYTGPRAYVVTATGDQVPWIGVAGFGNPLRAYFHIRVYRGLGSTDRALWQPSDSFLLRNTTIEAFHAGGGVPDLYGDPDKCCYVVFVMYGAKHVDPSIGTPFLPDYYEQNVVHEWEGPDSISNADADWRDYMKVYEYRATGTNDLSAYFGADGYPATVPPERFNDWGSMYFYTYFVPTRQIPLMGSDPDNAAPVGVSRYPLR